MKIAILTLPQGKNIGGILQLYALITFIKKNGHEGIVINRARKRRLSPGRLINKTVFEPILDYHLNQFIKKHINPKTKKIYFSEELEFINESDIDTIIVGSDQVWRHNYIKHMHKDYFLGFVRNKNIKKISYAASFGNAEWNFSENQSNEIKHWLQEFSAISVREKSGMNMCKNILDIDNVEHVLDPTLLLEENDYLNLIGYNDKKYNGILTYFLDLDDNKKSITKLVSEELMLDHFPVNVERQFSKKEPFKLHECIHPSVESWISGYKDCEFVITDSFHGLTFSLIFNKPFIAIGNEKRGMDRFISILDMIGMRHRLISNIDKVSKNLIHEKIDYCAINKNLSRYKKKSKEFLLNSIES